MQNSLHLRPLAEQLDKNAAHQLHRQVQFCQQLRHQLPKKEISELEDFTSLNCYDIGKFCVQKSRKSKLIVAFEYINEKKFVFESSYCIFYIVTVGLLYCIYFLQFVTYSCGRILRHHLFIYCSLRTVWNVLRLFYSFCLCTSALNQFTKQAIQSFIMNRTLYIKDFCITG